MQRSNPRVRAVALRKVVDPRIGQPADLRDLLQPTLNGETFELASEFVDNSRVKPGSGLHAHGALSTGIPVGRQAPRTGTSIVYGGTLRGMSCDPIRGVVARNLQLLMDTHKPAKLTQAGLAGISGISQLIRLWQGSPPEGREYIMATARRESARTQR